MAANKNTHMAHANSSKDEDVRIDAKGESKTGEDNIDVKGCSKTQEDYTDARDQTRTPRIHQKDFESVQYTMNRRGVALIINNKNLLPLSQHDDDAEMPELLRLLGFEIIQLHENLNAKQIKIELEKVAKMNHDNSDCFVCVILSRGEEGYILDTDKKKILLDELVQPFKGDVCRSLAGKPKLFFIQACRTEKTIAKTSTIQHDGPESGEKWDIRCIPVEADVLMTYAVIPAKPVGGLWFIKQLIKVFKENWQTMDLLTMLTRTNKKVAEDFKTHAQNEFVEYKMQIPCITSLLTKELYFAKFSK